MATVTANSNVEAYGRERDALHGLEEDYRVLRAAPFEVADLPAEPDDTWSTFIEVGEAH